MGDGSEGAYAKEFAGASEKWTDKFGKLTDDRALQGGSAWTSGPHGDDAAGLRRSAQDALMAERKLREPPILTKEQALELMNTPSENLSAAGKMQVIEDLLFEPQEDDCE